MNANTRIQWLHKKLTMGSYPNAQRLAERFKISHRQAQRDLEYLKKELGAPIAYDNSRKGFYYTQPYVLPLLFSSDNDDSYIPEIFDVNSRRELGADSSIIQMQIPYTATVEIRNKLTVLELTNYIIAKKPANRYVCEFHSIEKFIGMLLSIEEDFRVIEPYWLRERLVRSARRVLQNNEAETREDEQAADEALV
jgi:predicted DNA-binding transcriptional regulator YafY